MSEIVEFIVDFLAPNIWPLCFLLVAFTILRQLREEVGPIFKGMIGGLATQSQKNALAWGMAMMLGTAASLQAVVEVANQYHWLYIGAAAKVLQPGLVAIIGFVMKSPLSSSNPPTNSPFPPKP